MKPSVLCKKNGLKLIKLSKLTGVSEQTLINWFKTRPNLFHVIVQGARFYNESGESLPVDYLSKPPVAELRPRISTRARRPVIRKAP